MSSEVRLIKKYPNRRLYDTGTSSYITVADVRDMVMAKENIKVVDAKTGTDLTHSTLLQIILEAESEAGAPMLTSGTLSQFIRLYGSAMQGMMSSYIETNVEAFMDIQRKFGENAKAVAGAQTPSDMAQAWTQFLTFQGPAMRDLMGAYVERNSALAEQMKDSVAHQTRKMMSKLSGTAFEADVSVEAVEPEVAAKPAAAKPAAAKPAAAKPAAAKPASAKPASAKPAAAKPASAKPASAKPAAAKPAAGNS